jgi:hypothetical protein
LKDAATKGQQAMQIAARIGARGKKLDKRLTAIRRTVGKLTSTRFVCSG